ncbi:hypothetical protein L195_g018871 [Trifolium pratense]|uniref:Uncharacterized protein n=1 Tax=Trifolium pratense TaxID=57577 RepID=A0A2K3MY09_TRIPR|nr:hypothetical protein L195_g018871 [Trifolium pratense]
MRAIVPRWTSILPRWGPDYDQVLGVHTWIDRNVTKERIANTPWRLPGSESTFVLWCSSSVPMNGRVVFLHADAPTLKSVRGGVSIAGYSIAVEQKSTSLCLTYLTMLNAGG